VPTGQNSDAAPGDGRTPATVLEPDETDLTWDAGLVIVAKPPPPPPCATIGDRVWRDFDAGRSRARAPRAG